MQVIFVPMKSWDAVATDFSHPDAIAEIEGLDRYSEVHKTKIRLVTDHSFRYREVCLDKRQ